MIKKNETDELAYIKDRKLRARAVSLIGKFDEQKRSKYYKLAADIDCENADYSREYASFLFNKNRRLDAHPYYEHAADLGDIEACHMTGISYALGFNKANEGESYCNCDYFFALRYLRRSNKIKGEISIDEPLNKDCDGNELLLSDILGTEPDITSRNLEDEVDRALLRESISKLKKRKKDIMEMRFGFKTGKEKTQKEVADELRNFTKLYIEARKENNK